LRHVDLGDRRLHGRLVRIVESLAARPTASVPEACGSWAATKGAYRFWDSPRVTPEAIRGGHRQAVVERMMGHAMVLLIQDTTALNFTHHPSTQGLGYLDLPTQQGLRVHSTLAATVEGVPLGLVHQEVWTRDPAQLGISNQRAQRETHEKESQRWLTALAASQVAIPDSVSTLTVADREADIYDFLAAPRRPGDHLLIRAAHNRRVSGEACYLWDAMRQSPPRGQCTIQVQHKGDRPARGATLTVRYQVLEVQPPRNRRGRRHLKPVPIQVILAEEENPPVGEPAVRWLLLTTLPVDSFAQAMQAVHWYSLRWLVERYSYVLKSGCGIEDLQLQTGDRLQRALATYAMIAWRLLWLTYEARRHGDAPCDTALEAHEWQSLYCTIHDTPVPPTTPPTLQEAVRWIAQLGGFLARRHDCDPGVKVIWRGLRRLSDIAPTWELARRPAPT
jgi:hypothetical protein